MAECACANPHRPHLQSCRCRSCSQSPKRGSSPQTSLPPSLVASFDALPFLRFLPPVTKIFCNIFLAAPDACSHWPHASPQQLPGFLRASTSRIHRQRPPSKLFGHARMIPRPANTFHAFRCRLFSGSGQTVACRVSWDTVAGERLAPPSLADWPTTAFSSHTHTHHNAGNTITRSALFACSPPRQIHKHTRHLGKSLASPTGAIRSESRRASDWNSAKSQSLGPDKGK